MVSIILMAALSMPPSPPEFRPHGPILTPKHSEFKSSLGKPLRTAQVIIPKAVPIAPAGTLVITNLTVSGNQVTLSWTPGTNSPPFQVEGISDLSVSNWLPLGAQTSSNQISFDSGTNHFFRVRTASNHNWVQSFGSTGTDSAQSIAKDAAGNLFVTGYFGGVMQAGPFTLISAGGIDMFLMKLSPEGLVLWAASFGASGNEQPASIALDTDSNIYVGGTFTGVGNFGGTNFTAIQNDCFLASFSPNGLPRWSTAFGSTSSDAITSIAITPSSVVCAGFIQGQTTIGDIVLSAGNFMSFAAGFSFSGIPSWAINANPNSVLIGPNYARSISTDAAGNSYLVGYSQAGTLNFGCGNMLCNTTKGYIAKLDPAGACLWQKIYGSDTQFTRFWASSTGMSELYIAGDFQFSTDLGGGPISGTSYVNDAFLVKYSTLNGSWITNVPVNGIAAAFIQPAFLSSSSTNVTFTGNLRGTFHFGSITVQGSGVNQNGFIALYNPDLTCTRVDYFTGDNSSQIWGNSYPISVGYFSGSTTIGGMPLSAVGGIDACIIYMQP